MTNNTESKTLLGVYKNVRALSNFFISKAAGTDIHNRQEVNGVKLNSIAWILGHLCWTENTLILRGIGNADAGIAWLEEFEIGSDPENVKVRLSFEELIACLDSIHGKAIKVLEAVNDEELDQDNHLGFTFGGQKSKRAIFLHAIRHEPMHIGQLSWALKLNGIKTV